jgi:hypothetical protein
MICESQCQLPCQGAPLQSRAWTSSSCHIRHYESGSSRAQPFIRRVSERPLCINNASIRCTYAAMIWRSRPRPATGAPCCFIVLCTQYSGLVGSTKGSRIVPSEHKICDVMRTAPWQCTEEVHSRCPARPERSERRWRPGTPAVRTRASAPRSEGHRASPVRLRAQDSIRTGGSWDRPGYLMLLRRH